MEWKQRRRGREREGREQEGKEGKRENEKKGGRGVEGRREGVMTEEKKRRKKRYTHAEVRGERRGWKRDAQRMRGEGK